MTLDISTTAFLAQMALADAPPFTELTPDEGRFAIGELARNYAKGPEMARVEEQTIPCADGASIRARIFTPAGETRAVFVYYHGGGWVLGSLDDYDSVARSLAERTRSVVVLVDYRLAPEHRYPAAANDAWDALLWAHKHRVSLTGGDAPIIVGGDSAGGNLAAVVTHKAKAETAPDIALQVLVYPVTDCAMDTASYKAPENQLLLNAELMAWFWNHYAPNPADRTGVMASPARAGDFADLPPAIVLTAEYDVLRDEGEAYAMTLHKAGVPVVLKRFERQMHNFFAMPGLLPGAAEGMEYVGEQIDRFFAAQSQVDAVVVGAGFAGLYQLHRLRGLGLKTRVIEAGGDVGGTWYWNRYPGARCDIESMAYSFSFSPELEQEWTWTEKYATQPEILRYAQHVADRFDLRKDITFDTKVTRAVYDEDAQYWVVHTDTGEVIAARYLILGTGCLSAPKVPDIVGADRFEGPTYVTGRWPHEGVDFSGLRVAVIGTGSSGIQSIPLIAEQAAHVTVYQRTPAYSQPAGNRPLTNSEVAEMKERYRDYRAEQRAHAVGVPNPPQQLERALDTAEAERTRRFEAAWNQGVLTGFTSSFTDLLLDEQANEIVSNFIRDKIRQTVKDPQTAEDLAPKSFPYGTKRPCLDTNYYETFNRDNVDLISIKRTPIEEITATGIRTSEGERAFDVIVFATGFDAMTGAIMRMDIRGAQGQKLQDKWANGPLTYLGLSVAGFPNLFTITGPSSPSVLSNMMVSIEQHVDWITDCIAWMGKNGFTAIEADAKAEHEWAEHTAALADTTLYPQADSWYIGANVPGKSRIFMAYVGGVGVYRAICDEVAKRGYEGFMTHTDRSA